MKSFIIVLFLMVVVFFGYRYFQEKAIEAKFNQTIYQKL